MIWLLLAVTLAAGLFMDFRVLRAIYRWIFACSAARPTDNRKDQLT